MSNDKSDSNEDKLLKALFGEDFNLENSAEESSTEKSIEQLPTIPNIWKELVTTPEIETLQALLIQHFSILTDTDECHELLNDIIRKVEKAEISDGRLVLSIKNNFR